MLFRGELQHKMDGNIRAISLKECRALMQQFDESKEVQLAQTGFATLHICLPSLM